MSKINYFILFVIVFIVFYPILQNDFQYYWDDQWMVFNHYTEGGINLKNIKSILTDYYNGQYGPVNELLFLFLYTFFGYEPFVFHLSSLILHIGCVFWVYIIVKKLLIQSTKIQYEYASWTSLFTALLFAIHPLNVESVAWISAVKILNYSFFYFAATYSFIVFLDKKKIRYYIYTGLLFTLSFGGKEQAVTFPIWLLLLYWLLGYKVTDKNIWIQISPFFLLSILFGIITMRSQAVVGAGVLANEISYPLWQRLILGCYSLFEYLSKFIFPYNLLYIYPFPIIHGESLPSWMLLYPSLFIIIIASLWRQLIRWPIAFGLLFFVIHIGITLHIIPLSRFAIIADRYIYVASVGLAFIVAHYFVMLCNKLNGKIRILNLIFFFIIVLCLSVYSNIRCGEWKNSLSIKKDLNELIKQRKEYEL